MAYNSFHLGLFCLLLVGCFYFVVVAAATVFAVVSGERGSGGGGDCAADFAKSYTNMRVIKFSRS